MNEGKVTTEEQIKKLLDEDYKKLGDKLKKMSRETKELKKRFFEVGKSRAFYSGSTTQKKIVKPKETKKPEEKKEINQ